MALPPPGVEFYRRPLLPPSVAFASDEGRLRFRRAMAAGTMECYFRLAEQFSTQDDPSYCGLSSLVVVLNALAVDPRKTWKGPWRWFHESSLDCCAPLEQVQKEGLTVDAVGCIARCNGCHAHVVRPPPLPPSVDVRALLKSFVDATSAGATPSEAATATALAAGDSPEALASLDSFREVVDVWSRRDDSFVLVSYSRQGLAQTGSGHFSPLGGYDAETDSVLILDVARFKLPPHWAPLPALWNSMRAEDPVTSLPRGYMIVSRMAAAPLVLFELEASACDVDPSVGITADDTLSVGSGGSGSGSAGGGGGGVGDVGRRRLSVGSLGSDCPDKDCAHCYDDQKNVRVRARPRCGPSELRRVILVVIQTLHEHGWAPGGPRDDHDYDHDHDHDYRHDYKGELRDPTGSHSLPPLTGRLIRDFAEAYATARLCCLPFDDKVSDEAHAGHREEGLSAHANPDERGPGDAADADPHDDHGFSSTSTSTSHVDDKDGHSHGCDHGAESTMTAASSRSSLSSPSPAHRHHVARSRSPRVPAPRAGGSRARSPSPRSQRRRLRWEILGSRLSSRHRIDKIGPEHRDLAVRLLQALERTEIFRIVSQVGRSTSTDSTASSDDALSARLHEAIGSLGGVGAASQGLTTESVATAASAAAAALAATAAVAPSSSIGQDTSGAVEVSRAHIITMMLLALGLPPELQLPPDDLSRSPCFVLEPRRPSVPSTTAAAVATAAASDAASTVSTLLSATLGAPSSAPATSSPATASRTSCSSSSCSSSSCSSSSASCCEPRADANPNPWDVVSDAALTTLFSPVHEIVRRSLADAEKDDAGSPGQSVLVWEDVSGRALSLSLLLNEAQQLRRQIVQVVG